MSMPRAEKIRGSQSMKVIWMSDPLWADFDHTLASRMEKKARENCGKDVVSMIDWDGGDSEDEQELRWRIRPNFERSGN